MTEDLVRPKGPDETPPPPPTPVRGKDLVIAAAYLLGLQAQEQALHEGKTPLEAFEEGWNLTADYLAVHDRRRPALGDVR